MKQLIESRNCISLTPVYVTASYLTWLVLNVISIHSSFIFWLVMVYYTRIIKDTWSPAEGGQAASQSQVLNSDSAQVKQFYGDLEAEAQAVVRSQNGKDSRDPFLPYCKRLSHPVFPYASPLQYQYTLCTLQCQNLVASWILLQNCLVEPSQPSSFIVTATEGIIKREDRESRQASHRMGPDAGLNLTTLQS